MTPSHSTMYGAVRETPADHYGKMWRKECFLWDLKDQGNISCKDGLNKGQKWYGPKRSRRYLEEVAKIHRRTEQKRYS